MKNKKIIVIGLIIVEIISCFLMYKSSQNKITKLTDVKLKDNNKNNMFAIMVKNSKGEYEEYTKGNTFPTTNDGYIFSKASCMDNTGKEIEGIVTTDGTSITVTGTTTAYCVIYFDLCSIPDKGFNSTNQITYCPVGGMYRYQGTDNVNNWICFGADEEICNTPSTASNYEEIVDKYMYRIIGVTPEGQLKLIKETFVKEGTITNFQWHNRYTTTDCATDGSKCTWPKSKIFNRLNGYCGTNNDLSENNNKCTGKTSGNYGDTNIFIGSSYYDYLTNNIWLNKIEDHEWKYGDTNSDGSYKGNSMYTIENGFTDTITAKIGLQYLHDYLYAYPGGQPGNSNDALMSWIFFQKDGYNTSLNSELFETRYGYVYGGSQTGYYVRDLNSHPSVGIGIVMLHTINLGVRPVFYLKSDVEILGGTGSKDKPYYLEETPTLTTLCKGYNDMGTCIKNKEDSIGNIANLTQDTPGDMHRYQGTDNVNNWICFGTTENCSTTEEGIDKYMYRIIGITSEGQLKLIKETFVKEGTEITFQWHNSSSSSSCGTLLEGGIKCTWPKSRIFNRLNGSCGTGNDLSESDNKCTGLTSGSEGDSNIFVGNSYYEYLQNTIWLNKIKEYEWKYGDTTDIYSYNGDAMYTIENGFTNKVTSKIGLQYLHDYYYAYPEGNPATRDNAETSWIYCLKDGYNIQPSYDWFQTRYSFLTLSQNNSRWVSNGTYHDLRWLNLTNTTSGVRPVFYLTDTIKIVSGIGSKTNPYIIKQ